jgi:hypothetical protein
MDNNMSNTKPTYNGGQQNQQGSAVVNNNSKGITISKGALIGGIVGCVGAGVGLGVVGCRVFGGIKAKRAEKAAKKAEASKKE